ncbi:MAG: hypothetical protein ACRDFB_00545, partial [Rhabdochlamydiaceae bacterium]
MGMRRSNGSGFMFNTQNNLFAVNLGADFVAEHEWGIKQLNKTLGVSDDQNILGIDRYRVTLPYPECVILRDKKNDVALLIV